MRKRSVFWALGLLSCPLLSGCERCSSTDSKNDQAKTSGPSEPGAKDGVCQELAEQRLGQRFSLTAGLTSRRLPDGRLAIGVVLGGEPHVALVEATAAVAVGKARTGTAVSGEVVRVTPALETSTSEVVAFVDARTAAANAEHRVRCLDAELVDCRTFVSPDARQTWLVGSKRTGAKVILVARRAAGVEEELLNVPARGRDLFEDLESVTLGDKGFAVTARYGDRVHLIRLKLDFTLEESREYGPGFTRSPELLSSGSGAMLLTSRRAFGRPRLVWAQFQDQSGRLPQSFDGSEHGLPALRPRRATAGSRVWLTFVGDEAPARLQVLPITPFFEAAGRGQFVTARDVAVDQASTVGFDDGRLVVVYVTTPSAGTAELMAKTLRCGVGP